MKAVFLDTVGLLAVWDVADQWLRRLTTHIARSFCGVCDW
jgi:hypothetical protein